MKTFVFGLFLLATPMPYAAAEKSTVGTDFADAIIARYQPTIDVLTNNGWDHSNSVVIHGIEKLYRQSRDPRYLNYIRAYVDSHVRDDGSVRGLRDTMDGLHPGVLCLFLFEETGEKKYQLAAKNMVDHWLGRNGQPNVFNKTPDGGYWHKNVDKYRNVMSVDGLYMAYPFLVRYAVATNEPGLLDVAAEQILLVSERSFNIKYGLPYHAWNYDKTKTWAHPITGTSSQFWSRASGWYSMALVDVLEYFPESHPAYERILFLYRSLADGLRRVQNPDDGFWYQVLDAYQRPDNYPETSSTGMITYALKKGMNLGLLSSSYTSEADRGWQALKTKIRPYGDGGPQITSFAPGMGSQADYKAYVAIRPVSVPSLGGEKQHTHGYMAVLMAASVMEPSPTLDTPRLLSGSR